MSLASILPVCPISPKTYSVPCAEHPQATLPCPGNVGPYLLTSPSYGDPPLLMHSAVGFGQAPSVLQYHEFAMYGPG